MSPKAAGGSTPLGPRPLCVLTVVQQLWASVSLVISSGVSSFGFLIQYLVLSKSSAEFFIMPRSSFGSCLRLTTGFLGLRLGAFPRVAPVACMVFTVALYVPWCWYLEGLRGVTHLSNHLQTTSNVLHSVRRVDGGL